LKNVLDKVRKIVSFIGIASRKLNSNLFCMSPISTSSSVMKNQPSPPNSTQQPTPSKMGGKKNTQLINLRNNQNPLFISVLKITLPPKKTTFWR
jgi:hypothetical protein